MPSANSRRIHGSPPRRTTTLSRIDAASAGTAKTHDPFAGRSSGGGTTSRGEVTRNVSMRRRSARATRNSNRRQRDRISPRRAGDRVPSSRGQPRYRTRSSEQRRAEVLVELIDAGIPRTAVLPLLFAPDVLRSSSTSYSSSISPTISSITSSIVTSPAIPPYSSTTIAMWLRDPRNSFSSTSSRLDSGMNHRGAQVLAHLETLARARPRTCRSRSFASRIPTMSSLDLRPSPVNRECPDSTTAGTMPRGRRVATHGTPSARAAP